MTVRAVHNDNLILEARVGVRNHAAVDIREAECKRLIGILHVRVVVGIGRLRQTFGASLHLPYRREALQRRVRAVQRQRQSAVRLRRDLQNEGASAVKTVQHKFAILVLARDRARIAIDAQNRRQTCPAQFCRRINRQACSPLVLSFGISHTPEMSGAFTAAAATAWCGRASRSWNPLRLLP